MISSDLYLSIPSTDVVISVDCVPCGSVIPLTVTPPLDVLPSDLVVVGVLGIVVGVVVGANETKVKV